MDGKLRSLYESDLYQKQCNEVANIRHVDEALNILTFAIARNPKKFHLIPGHEGIRLAKIDPYSRGEISVPPLRVWFREIDDDCVELLAIEPYEKNNE